ncbi:MAG: hypothetical protein EB127_15855, partial [Alphaproteobacteria bacterium]|nr:hypothetical protein [Alphaproteobacteria bacterium]
TGLPTGSAIGSATGSATGLPTGSATGSATVSATGLPTAFATGSFTVSNTGLPTGPATESISVSATGASLSNTRLPSGTTIEFTKGFMDYLKLDTTGASGQQADSIEAAAVMFIRNEMESKIQEVNVDINAKKGATTEPLSLDELEIQRLTLIIKIMEEYRIRFINQYIQDINNTYRSKLVGVTDPVKLTAIQSEWATQISAEQSKQLYITNEIEAKIQTLNTNINAKKAEILNQPLSGGGPVPVNSGTVNSTPLSYVIDTTIQAADTASNAKTNIKTALALAELEIQRLTLIKIMYEIVNNSTMKDPAVKAYIDINPKTGKFILSNNLMDQTVETNNFSARYVRILPAIKAGDGWLNLSQIIVTDSTGKVISNGKTVYPSSTMSGSADAQTLTNGDPTVKSFPHIWCTEFGSRDTDFVEIDLGSEQSISSVRLLGRNDCGSEEWCINRMLYVRIELLTTTTNEALEYYSSHNPQTSANIQASAAQGYSDMEASAAKAFNSIGNDPKNGKYILISNGKNQVVLMDEIIGRYIRIRPSATKGDGFINLSQICVYDILGLNIAPGRPVYATSSHPRTSPPSSVVDGATEPRKYPNFWHSNKPDRDNEYIEIDLGSEQYITGVRILGIQSCPRTLGNCYNRMLELRIEVNKETSGAAKETFETIRNYISLCGSSNASNSISFIRSENNAPIKRIDPSLPEQYTRYWNKKCRAYVYHDSDNQIVPHPLGPRMRKYMDHVKRVPKIRVPTHNYATKLYSKPPIMTGGYVISDPELSGAQDSGAETIYTIEPDAMASSAQASAAIDLISVLYDKQVSSAKDSSAMTSGAMTSGAINISFKPFPMDVQVLVDPTLPAPWVKYFDTKIRKYFYVNPVLSKEVWEHPVIPPEPKKSTKSYTDESLPVTWKKYLDPDTNTFYYYDTDSTETTWDHPYPPPYPGKLTKIKTNDLSPLYAKFKSPKGDSVLDSFYYNTLTTETFWDFPQTITSNSYNQNTKNKNTSNNSIKAKEAPPANQALSENEVPPANQVPPAKEAPPANQVPPAKEAPPANQVPPAKEAPP